MGLFVGVSGRPLILRNESLRPRARWTHRGDHPSGSGASGASHPPGLAGLVEKTFNPREWFRPRRPSDAAPSERKIVAIFQPVERGPRKANLIRVHPRPGRPTLGLLTCGNLVLPCALGRSGTTRFKREGDGATPAGHFALLGGRRRADRAPPPPGPFVLRPTKPHDGWCDDVTDGRYNRAVRLPFAGSHEELWRDDHLYDVMIVLDANFRRRVIGRGSAIFFHLAKPNFEPTAGCVALRPDDMRRLLAELGRKPVMVIG